MTGESCTGGEMSAIAARITVCGNTQPKNEEASPSKCSSFVQLPIPENKVCPM